MKIKRQKQARHNISIYKNIFKFREPYQVLIDGTFCQASLTQKVQIKDQLSKYLQCTVQCCTTRCVLAELELLGKELYGARMIAQRLQLRSCPHRNSPVQALQCLKSLIGEKNEGRYMIATQDPMLTKCARETPGVPLIYIYHSNIVLDKPSKCTLDFVKQVSQEKVVISETDRAHLTSLKKDANLVNNNSALREIKRKRKRAKGPNPMSCKKKKTKKA